MDLTVAAVVDTGIKLWTRLGNWRVEECPISVFSFQFSEFQLFKKLMLPVFLRTLAAWQRIVSIAGTDPFMRLTPLPLQSGEFRPYP